MSTPGHWVPLLSLVLRLGYDALVSGQDASELSSSLDNVSDLASVDSETAAAPLHARDFDIVSSSVDKPLTTIRENPFSDDLPGDAQLLEPPQTPPTDKLNAAAGPTKKRRLPSPSIFRRRRRKDLQEPASFGHPSTSREEDCYSVTSQYSLSSFDEHPLNESSSQGRPSSAPITPDIQRRRSSSLFSMFHRSRGSQHLTRPSTVTRFGPKVGQIGSTWDKSDLNVQEFPVWNLALRKIAI